MGLFSPKSNILSISFYCHPYNIIHVSNLATSLCNMKVLAVCAKEVLPVIKSSLTKEICLKTSSWKSLLIDQHFFRSDGGGTSRVYLEFYKKKLQEEPPYVMRETASGTRSRLTLGIWGLAYTKPMCYTVHGLKFLTWFSIMNQVYVDGSWWIVRCQYVIH